MKRLFYALWPDAAIRRDCFKIAKSIVRPGEIRVRPDNLHATLVFLGSVDAATEASVIQGASAIPAPQVKLAFDTLSFWSKPRILCLTAQPHDAELETLVNELTALSRRLGIPVDERPFNPHVTLVRKVKSPRQLEFEPIIWRSSGFCLVQSCSEPEGTIYRTIKSWPSRG